MKFNTYIMEDALEAIIDYRGKTPQKSESGIPTLSAKSVKNNFIDYNNCYYISQEEYNRFMVRGFPKKGDILLTTEAPLGMVAKLDRDDIAIAQRLLTLRGKNNILDNDYLLYFLQSSTGQHLLKSHETGTTVTGIKQAVFRKLEISIPNIEDQRKIATILSALDSRISINTAINENLEQQAQALFKAHFGNNNLQTVRFGDIATFKYGKMPKKDKISVEGYPLFSGYQIVGYYPEKMFDEPQIIVVARGVGGCGDIKYTPSNCYLTNLSIAITPNDSAFEDYLYRLLKNTDMKILNTGSAQPQITVDSLQKFEIEIPSREDAMHYSSIITPIKIQYRLNNAENQHLAALRDTLLPKLMSGEIDVSAVKI